MSTFEVYKDKKGETRFRYRASNGEIVFSSEGYKAKASALKSIESIKKNVAGAAIEDQTIAKPAAKPAKAAAKPAAKPAKAAAKPAAKAAGAKAPAKTAAANGKAPAKAAAKPKAAAKAAPKAKAAAKPKAPAKA